MRQRIMDAAVEELHAHSTRFTMNDLAARLGVSKRTLYQHFPSKQSLVEGILLSLYWEVHEQRRLILQDSTRTCAEKLQAMLSVRSQAFATLGLAVFQDLYRQFPEVWEKLARYVKEEWPAFEQVLEEGVQKGEFRHLPSSLLLALIRGATREILLMDPAQCICSQTDLCDKGTRMDILADILLHGICGKGETV